MTPEQVCEIRAYWERERALDRCIDDPGDIIALCDDWLEMRSILDARTFTILDASQSQEEYLRVCGENRRLRALVGADPPKENP